MLPAEIQAMVWRLYYTHHVLAELQSTPRRRICSSCLEHGCPCVHCAALKLHFRHGPGFLNHKRTVVYDVLVPNTIRLRNLLHWLIDVRGPGEPVALINAEALVREQWSHIP